MADQTEPAPINTAADGMAFGGQGGEPGQSHAPPLRLPDEPGKAAFARVVRLGGGAISGDGQHLGKGAAPPGGPLFVPRVAMVGADFIPGQAGEVMADGGAGEMVDGVAGLEALQGVVRLVVGVLEIGRPALQLQKDIAAEGGGGIHVVPDVTAGAEIGGSQRVGEFVAALREGEDRDVGQGGKGLTHAPNEVGLHGIAVVIKAEDDAAGGRLHQLDAGADGTPRQRVLDEAGARIVLPHEGGGAIRAAIRGDEQFVRRGSEA